MPTGNEWHYACIRTAHAGIGIQLMVFDQLGDPYCLGEAATPTLEANASDGGIFGQYVGHAIGQAEAEPAAKFHFPAVQSDCNLCPVNAGVEYDWSH